MHAVPETPYLGRIIWDVLSETQYLGRRRKLLGLLGGNLALGLSGCGCMHPFAKPEIGEMGRFAAERDEVPFLKPVRSSRTLTQGIFCVDVHAHFFNASDVTVKGYLEGPVAHKIGGSLGRLVRLLAPLADGLAEIAPKASAEYDKLGELSAQARLQSQEQFEAVLDGITIEHRTAQSRRFYELLLASPDGRRFLEEYERIKADALRARPAVAPESQILSIDESSLRRAIEMGEQPRRPSLRDQSIPGGDPFYAEGILAFVAYMLSYRWTNLRSYKKQFSERDGALGVDRVLGALVDFDRWLDCPPRSSHEDQVRLHARLSKLSDGYMLPLASYNPWTDVEEQGKSLGRLVQAVNEFKFVGAKIYPANGFRPWNNTAAQDGPGLPSHDAINGALMCFWDKCIELDIPVMAHTGQSMGKDDAHDVLAAPEWWGALVDAYAVRGKSPRVNLGHFGGDTSPPANDWTKRMAEVMKKAGGDKVFGDLGYWAELQCGVVGDGRCEAAALRLTSVLDRKAGANERVADRVMFGSDWLMLSREENWASYASELFIKLRSVVPGDVERIFGGNALKCFGQRIR
ncbi:MAG TPA: amidohydrolase family protein [Burkholderiales bacterium]|nr:amidohydrolase family protein [Burkholderiales bacterium]